MLNPADFKELMHEMKEADARREKLIQLSRDIIRESKLIIYALQRDEKSDIKKIQGLFKQLRKESATGIEDTAVQEYVEALCFYRYVHDTKIPSRQELGVDTENYLMGLCDLTGELVRKAVKDVIEKRYESARAITMLVEEIYGAFLQLDLRNGPLRQKSDSIKWNLQKLEHLMLDIARK